jgi:hypothetical protein
MGAVSYSFRIILQCSIQSAQASRETARKCVGPIRCRMGARPVPAAHVETSRRTPVRFTGRRAWRGWNGCPHLFPQVFLSALIIAHPTQATWLWLRAALSDSSRAQSQSRGRTPAGCSTITAPITMRGTMILPGETAAGSAGMQPYRGIAWWAHRDDHSSTRISFPRSCQGVFKAR